MLAQDAKFSQLLDTLAEHALLKAALLLDRFGRVKDKRGDALSLKAQPGDEDRTIQLNRDAVRENLFMLEVDAYILVVIFDENINFEEVKTDVENLLEQLELR